MAESSRKYILGRRGTGIGNLSALTLESDGLDIEAAALAGVYKVNCTHQVGIATATEVGLSPDRYPYRVVLCADGVQYPAEVTEACASYWRLVTATGESIRFSRKPLASSTALGNLYKYIQGLDDKLWTAYDALQGIATGNPAPDPINQAVEALYATLCVQAPTGEQIATINSTFDAIVAGCIAATIYPRFKVADNVYLVCNPHGRQYMPIGTTNADRVALLETQCCIVVNRDMLRKRHPDAADGLITLGAYSIANMFRMGLYESHEHREFYTLYVGMVAGSPNVYTVKSIGTPRGVATPTDYAAGSTIDCSKAKVKKDVIELGNMCVVGSGLMHYLFNHTTGGQSVNGVLLSMLSMYQLVTPDTSQEETVETTSVIYECLHPSNKRAIANLFFKNSGVTTHGRSSLCPTYSRFDLDAFISIRANPYPAGSHKAFILMTALRRVLQAGLGPFLPWADQLDVCIQMCKDVMHSGARAHIGSAYYTGEPPRAQPASLDLYLPELAQYVNTFNKGDSLSMSPHMSPEIAKKSAMNWQHLLKDLKSNDVSATSAEVVRTFLASNGGAYFKFDPNDQSTWADAAQTAGTALTTLNNIFN